MTVMPNPLSSNGLVTYNLAESMDVMLQVSSSDGRIVYQQDLGSQGQGKHTVSIGTNNLISGTYHLQILNDKGLVSKRIVVINQ